MGNIEIQYAWWYVLICLVVGAVFAIALYYRTSGFPDVRQWTKSSLAFIRFLGVSLLSLLLLSPILKTSQEETKKPIVIFAQDQSASIQAETDSVELQAYQEKLSGVISELSDVYDVKSVSFGGAVEDGISFRYADKSSNLSAVLHHIGDLYGDQNLGAVIYATDGIYNEGVDPLYADHRFSAPLYAIALGDSTQDKDLYIRQVFHNNISYLGDHTSLQVDVSSFNCDGQSSSVKVFRINGDEQQLLQSLPIRIDQDDFFKTYELAIPQDYVGLQRFRISLDGLGGEKSYANNRKDFFIDAIDARQQVLVLYGSPHPDIATIKHSLEKNKNYEVTVSQGKEFRGAVEEYDFVILHQLPSKRNEERRILRELVEQNVPRLLIVGSQTNLSLFNQYQDLVQITPKGINTNVVQANVHPGFSLFTLSEHLQQQISSFAPMDAPFAEFKVNPAADILLKQRIGKVDTEFPLWIFGEDGKRKEAIILAEGLWRWGLYDFLQHEDQQVLDEILGKSVQYISLKEDKRKFRVFQTKNLLAENEDARFSAELYNQSYELINEPEVILNIYNASRETFNFVFSKMNDAYDLDVGKLPAGDYTWTASTQYDGERFSAKGQFSVQAIEKESYATVANHNLLRRLANQTGGDIIYPSQVDELSEMIKQDDQLKPIFYKVFQTKNAINIKWLFLAILLLLASEWGLRRYLGSY